MTKTNNKISYNEILKYLNSKTLTEQKNIIQKLNNIVKENEQKEQIKKELVDNFCNLLSKYNISFEEIIGHHRITKFINTRKRKKESEEEVETIEDKIKTEVKKELPKINLVEK